ncbi:hypothetical protein C8Q73DRAFT_689802 [Cubamyces lactineus]|nr:hypothetical protein C8Q73DRAFT_689802 [Cubamyces lactineus]
MTPFFSTTASSAGKRSLAFIGRAASRLINTFQSAVHRPDQQQTLSETAGEENTSSRSQAVPEIDAESVTDADEDEDTSTEESVQDLVASEDSNDTEDLMVDPSAEGTTELQSNPRYSPFRARREFLLPRAPTPPRVAPSEDNAPELQQASPSDQPDQAFPAHATQTVPTSASATHRGTKRARTPEDDGSSEESDAGPSTSPLRRPHVRRRLSIPHPRCRRERCLARHLHMLDRFPSERRAASDDEGAWSTTPQAGESEPEPETAMQEDAPARQHLSLPQNPRRRSRDARDDDHDAETGTPSKRSRR